MMVGTANSESSDGGSVAGMGTGMKKSHIGAMRWIWRTSSHKAYLVAVLAVSQMLISLIGVGMAWLIKELIDCAVSRSIRGFVTVGGALIGIIIVQAAAQAVNRYASELAKATLENLYKKRLLDVAVTGDYGRVSAIHSGEWMNRLTNDTQVVANGIAEILPGLLSMLTKLVGAVVLLAFMLPELTILLIIGGIAMIGASYLFRKVMKTLHKKIQEADGRFRVLVTECLSGLIVIRAFSRETQVLADADKAMGEHKSARMKRNHFWNMCNIGFSLAINGAYVLGALWCGWGILKGVLSYGTFVAVIQLVSQIQAPMANISSYVPRLYAMTASAERLMEIESVCRMNDSTEACDIQIRDFDKLELKDVSFTYGEDGAENRRTVLNRFNLTISRGSCTALVGPSGAGKSTVLKLLMGLYRPKDGACMAVCGDHDIALGTNSRDLFAYVPQGNCLMSGTIRECVTFGDESAMQDEPRIESALRNACAYDFVMNLPDGIDTKLGERGSGLSEGQMQRLAIARALFSGRPVLLLDECTSSLDGATERDVLEHLRRLSDTTVVIVTHRPAALELADQVVTVAAL